MSDSKIGGVENADIDVDNDDPNGHIDEHQNQTNDEKHDLIDIENEEHELTRIFKNKLLNSKVEHYRHIYYALEKWQYHLPSMIHSLSEQYVAEIIEETKIPVPNEPFIHRYIVVQAQQSVKQYNLSIDELKNKSGNF